MQALLYISVAGTVFDNSIVWRQGTGDMDTVCNTSVQLWSCFICIPL